MDGKASWGGWWQKLQLLEETLGVPGHGPKCDVTTTDGAELRGLGCAQLARVSLHRLSLGTMLLALALQSSCSSYSAFLSLRPCSLASSGKTASMQMFKAGIFYLKVELKGRQRPAGI